MSYEILDKIKQAIEGYKDNAEWEEIGRIIEVGDGILKISGLTNVQSQEVLIIETDKRKIASSAIKHTSFKSLPSQAFGRTFVLGLVTQIRHCYYLKR